MSSTPPSTEGLLLSYSKTLQGCGIKEKMQSTPAGFLTTRSSCTQCCSFLPKLVRDAVWLLCPLRPGPSSALIPLSRCLSLTRKVSEQMRRGQGPGAAVLSLSGEICSRRCSGAVRAPGQRLRARISALTTLSYHTWQSSAHSSSLLCSSLR